MGGHTWSDTGTCIRCGIDFYQSDIAPSCQTIRLTRRNTPSPYVQAMLRKRNTTTKEREE